jgi:hypothetical protein
LLNSDFLFVFDPFDERDLEGELVWRYQPLGGTRNFDNAPFGSLFRLYFFVARKLIWMPSYQGLCPQRGKYKKLENVSGILN